MDSGARERLQKLKRDLAARCFEQGDWSGALEALGDANTAADKALAARCHYELMKEACTEESGLAKARSHAKSVIQSGGASRAQSYLSDQRLRLLQRDPPAVTWERPFTPGRVSVPGVGSVPVLGIYPSRGHSGNLRDEVLLLKKAPEELDARQDRLRPRLIQAIGFELFRVLCRLDVLRSVDLILPMPADFERFATRGFNQAELIAQPLAVYAVIPCLGNVLVKVRGTRDLRGLSPPDREVELAGTMAVADKRGHLVEDQSVLLVDDVVTYGTHFTEARRLLMEAGARQVTACALATARQNLVAL